MFHDDAEDDDDCDGSNKNDYKAPGRVLGLHGKPEGVIHVMNGLTRFLVHFCFTLHIFYE